MSTTSGVIDITLDADPKIQLSGQQSGRLVINTVHISNRGAADLIDLRVSVAFDPEVGVAEGCEVRELPAQQTLVVTGEALGIRLSAERLMNQVERQNGHVTVRVSDADGEALAEVHSDLQVLAHNEWPGGAAPPELLAAFVTPNHPAVAGWLSHVVEHLAARGHSSALDGYQSRDPQRVLQLAAAVYASLGRAGVTYANPPASFEKTGQKIRTPDQVATQQLATCLDIAVLFAAMLEQTGLHPFIVMEDGHAYPGVWLTDWYPPRPWLDDVTDVRKRVQLGEALVFDSSAAANGVPFDRACAHASGALKSDRKFLYAVDIKGARDVGVRPLSVAVAPDTLAARRDATIDVGAALPQIPTVGDASDDTPQTRFERWKARLLDLTLNNRLLNHKDAKTTLPLLQLSPAAVEAALRNGASLTLSQRPDARTHPHLVPDEYSSAQLQRGQLVVDLPDVEHTKRVTELYRTGRNLIQEAGNCPIYIVYGMLRWFESPTSDVERLAPIILQPVLIERDSVRGPYRVRTADDEPMVNVSLLKKLEHDFGLSVAGLTELATTAQGIDVDETLLRFVRFVRDEPRFEVVHRADIALYQFRKFLMWLDLEQNTDLLLKSDVVQHLLIGSDAPFPRGPDFPDIGTLDRDRPAAADLSVVDADSSQLAAIYGALDGNSFVLQGPPGTGKSQTITNLIAHALGAGKTVLFVSEKRAALEVVHHRLERAGLGPFTLEAHSDKASKTQLVDQLRAPFSFQWSKSRGEWEHAAATLERQRTQLNTHAERMHAAGPWGESLFQALSALIGLADVPFVDVPFSPHPDRDKYDAMRATVGQLARRTAAIGRPAAHRWSHVRETRWTPEWQRSVAAQVSATATAARRLDEALQAAAHEFSANADAADQQRLLCELGALLLTSPSPTAALLAIPHAELQRVSDDLQARLGQRAERDALVLAAFTPAVYDADVATTAAQFKRWANAFFLLAFFALFLARRRLAKLATGALPPNEQVRDTLTAAAEVAALDAGLTAETDSLRQLFGHHWRGPTTDGAELSQLIQWVEKFRAARAHAHEAWGSEATARLTDVATSPDLLADGTRARRTLEDLQQSATSFADADAALAALLKSEQQPAAAGDFARELEDLSDHVGALREWCDWRESADAVIAFDPVLAPIVDAVFAGTVDSSTAVPSLDRALRQSWFETRVREDDSLRRFRGTEHEAVIDEFRKLDTEARHIARAEIQARLAARLPDPTAPGEMAILQREFTKQRSHKPLRQLYKEAPHVMLRLKPCVLMSPLSVARFLDPDLDLFDLVVFDEASQIPPWDAVGALARARQAIVVGDSRQLPPTTFFGVSADDENPDDLDQFDMDSVLEECIGAGMPQLRLNWHYRSRHESLIAFSNRQYYDNNLHVFPSPHRDVPQLGVKWEHVPDGYYDRGKSATNRAEAEAVVAEVVRRLTDPTLCEKSIGVVTFSMRQQRCVEDLMDEARRQHPEIERFFADVSEPVFIKNLENVQGDERDVILFSVCYAADVNGKVTMNFGPLNRAGGERRLNVAVTRARELLVVFSTLTPDQIDLSRTSAVGVRDLKTFLDYAKRGLQAIREATLLDSERGFDSPFEAQVAAALQKLGWTVRSQVGVGGYWIDLAVVHPENPGAYVLGIECDGAAYHSAKTARDRDRIRQSVLESLGWTIHRIWSTDWWYNPTGEIEKIRAAYEAALNAREYVPPTVPPAPPALPSRTDEIERPSWPDGATVWVEPILPDDTSTTVVDLAMMLVQQSGPLSLDDIARRIVATWEMRATSAARRGVTAPIRSGLPHLVSDDTLWPAPDHPRTGFRYVEGDASRDLTQVLDWELDNALTWVIQRAVRASREDVRRELGKVFGATRMGRKIVEQLDAVIDRAVQRGQLIDDDGMLSS